MELSTVDYGYLLREWQPLIGGRIQKVYMKDRMLVLQVYNKANYTWLFTDGISFLTSAKLTFPQTPNGFTMFLRKRLQGCRIRTIEMVGFDRIVRITAENKEGAADLIVELFGKANYAFCKDGKIVSVFETHTYTDRTLKGGAVYMPPPSKPAPWDVDLTVLVGKEAAKHIATDLGLGGKYSEEVCVRAGLAKKHHITKEDLPGIKKHLQIIRETEIQPLYNETDAVPFPFLSRPGEYKQAKTYNEALDAVEREHLEGVEENETIQQHKEKLTKQQKIIAAQQKQLETLNRTIEENQRKGELMYEKYTELQTLFTQLKTDMKKLTPAQLKEKYANHPTVKSIETDGTIEVEL
jgi:predicted ribosome quality control (RQC) complex YloA/Tae2 family protein